MSKYRINVRFDLDNPKEAKGHRSDLTSDQLGRKLETAEIIAQQSDDSKSQVRRYIRLTYLIPEFLEKMDKNEIAAGHRGDAGRISEGGSSSFLGGNMAMAALSAKFYKITGEQKYLDRVYATNAGILQHYNNNGVLLNDRDAWTNGTFASFYASWVLTLPDTEQMQQLMKDTAVSIVTNDRTADGYYGGSWQGPPAGPSSVWASGGSVAQQTMTSGTTVAIVVGTALLEAGIQDYVR